MENDLKNHLLEGGKMKPLITIETIPIKIEYVKKEPLRLSSVQAPKMKKNNEESLQEVQNNHIRISLNDSFKPSADYLWDNLTYTATAKYGDDGKLKLEVQMEDGQAKPIRFTQSTRGIDHMADLFSAPEKDTASIEISLDLGRLPGGMSAQNSQTIEFFPPDIELKITQRPKVIIKYVGGPIYTPASADPDYVPPEDLMKTPELTQGVKLDIKI